MQRKLIFYIIIFAAAGLFCGSIIKQTIAIPTFGKKIVTVLLDAGHGAPDGGTTGVGGTIEKDINLKIVKKLQEVMEGKGMRVILTREGDEGLQDSLAKTIREMKVSDMHKRLDIMKKSNADLFLSIHMNSFPNADVSGLRVFYSKNHEDIKLLAENIQDRISQISGAKAYAVKTADTKLFLMKEPPVPSILVECGFLTNPQEEKLLNDEEYQSKIAWAIADAVEKYHISSKK